MKKPLNGSLFKAVLFTLTTIISGCGNSDMKSENVRDVKVSGEEQAAGTGDCFGLSNKNQPYRSPYQGKAGYDDIQKKQAYYEEDVVLQSKRPNIVRRPCTNPNQSKYEARPIPGRAPCTVNCDDWAGAPDDVYLPIEPGFEPTPWPIQHPVEQGKCGINGNYCNYPGQTPPRYPGVAVGGTGYNQQDVERCMGAFQSAGMRHGGMWQVKAQKINSVSVLSSGIVEDFGIDNNIVMINSVNVLGTTDFHLLNPNALYCIKDVSVLNRLRITSCHTSNVVVGNSVSVLSDIDTRVVQCR